MPYYRIPIFLRAPGLPCYRILIFYVLLGGLAIELTFFTCSCDVVLQNPYFSRAPAMLYYWIPIFYVLPRYRTYQSPTIRALIINVWEEQPAPLRRRWSETFYYVLPRYRTYQSPTIRALIINVWEEQPAPLRRRWSETLSRAAQREHSMTQGRWY
jgi:hypothetical protein